MVKRQVNFLCLAVWLGWGFPDAVRGETPDADVFRNRAFAAYEEANRLHQANPTDLQATCRLGRAVFDWAEFATNSAQRAELAELGIGICRQAVNQAPTNAAAQLYLGMNQGQLARSRPFSALRLVREMEANFDRARSLEEKFEFAAPDRLLGLLYQQTPGWPASIGNKSKARHHLTRAVELEPDFPDNRLSLAEALAEWKDWKQVAKEVTAIAEMWPRAKQKWQGQRWEENWTGWEERWKALQAVNARHRSGQ